MKSGGLPGKLTRERLIRQTTHPAQATVPGASETIEDAALKVVFCPDRSLLGQTLPLSPSVLTIGRDAGQGGLTVIDPRMSRAHVRVAFDAKEQAYRVGDSISKNGTWVNGERVESSLLDIGDVVRTGDTLFVYAEGERLPAIYTRAQKIAASTLTTLIIGETGTGKELLARAVHEWSGRGGKFIAVNCAALPRDLIASELFGHARGAFSGAVNARQGLIRAASGGTLFLDEIGDLPLELQATLLRVLQEGTLRPLGSDAEVEVDVRVVSATHQNLNQLVKAGDFRADLYARLSQATLQLPALRERRTDLLQLLHEIAEENQRQLSLTADAAEALLLWEWPLNVRELQSLLLAFLAVNEGVPSLDVNALREAKPEMFMPQEEERSSRPRGHYDEDELRRCLEEHGGNVARVAKQLGKPRAQIYRWLKAMGVTPDEFRR